MLLPFSPPPSKLETVGLHIMILSVAAATLAIPSRHVATRRDRRPISTTQSRTPTSFFSSGAAAAAAIRHAKPRFVGHVSPPNAGGEEAALCSDYRTVDEIKTALYEALQGTNRGIFGVKSPTKAEIEGLVELLESQNPTPEPTDHLHKVGGCWRLVYSTITILGAKRTKLGLRDFITLGDFKQTIDVSQGRTTNEIKFNARGFQVLEGQLTVEASFKIVSPTRVDIKYEDSRITPDQLKKLFQKNYDLLLSVFNPDGWLEITYVDDSMRIGRDDKGNIFILEKNEDQRF